MKLLMIGGTGVLSSAVLIEALKQQYDVTIVNRGHNNDKVPSGVHIFVADYRDSSAIEPFLQNKTYDAVIDFVCYDKEQIDYSINLLAKHCNQYIFISSACVYDYTLPGVKTEDSPKVFKDWNYSVNKWDCECYLTEKASKKNYNFTIIRPCITYDDTRIPYGIVPDYGYHWALVSRILSGKPVIRWNGGTTKWNMMRVEDFAVGIVGLIGNEKAYNESFNVCGDYAYSWNDVIEAIEKVVNKKAVFYDIDSNEFAEIIPGLKSRILGRSSDLVCSNRKIKEIVPSFKSRISLQDGIEKTINAYIKNNYQMGIDYRFEALMDYVIWQSCKNHHISPKNYNLEFVDYLKKSSNRDIIIYYAVRFKRRFLNNSGRIPLFGFGTFPYTEKLVNSIQKAILGGKNG